MKKLKKFSLFSLLLLPLITGCGNPGSSTTTDSTSPTIPSQVTNISKFVASPYGTVTCNAAVVEPGSEVEYQVKSYSNQYLPSKLKVNDEVFDLDADGKAVVKMAEGGNLVTPLFLSNLSNLGVSTNYNSISVESRTNAEYRIKRDFEGEEWSDWATSGTFNGLVPHSNYFIEVRVNSDGETLLESEVKELTVQTIPVASKVLSSLNEGNFAVSGTLSTDYTYMDQVLQSTTLGIETSLTSSRFILSTSNDKEKSTITYYRGSGNTVEVRQIDRHNVQDYLPVDGLVFTDTFYSPFSQVTADNVHLEGSNLVFEMDEITNTNAFGLIFFGDDSLYINAITMGLTPDGNPASLEISAYTMDTVKFGAKYEFTLRSDFVGLDEVKPAEDEEPLPTVEGQEVVAEALTALKGQNYTVHKTKNETGKTTPEKTTYISTNSTEGENPINAALIQREDGTEVGFYHDERGTFVYDVDKTGEEPIMRGREGSPSTTTTIESLRPDFDFAPETFDVKEEGHFHLKYLSNFYSFASQLCPDFIDLWDYSAGLVTPDTLDIVVEKDGESISSVTITYEYSYKETSSGTIHAGDVELEITDIGTTVFPYSQFVPYGE